MATPRSVCSGRDVKRIKAVVLDPRTLRYVRRYDGQESEVSLDEVYRSGEDNAGCRNSIVTSTETLNTIVRESLRQLDRLHRATGDKHLQIIASAFNDEHGRQIVEAYRACNRNADYVRPTQDSYANGDLRRQTDEDNVEVIVQLGTHVATFAHTLFAVAAIFSLFTNLSSFLRFIEHITPATARDSLGIATPQAVVVFHGRAAMAPRWEEFQQYTEADQEYFDQLLPIHRL